MISVLTWSILTTVPAMAYPHYLSCNKYTAVLNGANIMWNSVRSLPKSGLEPAVGIDWSESGACVAAGDTILLSTKYSKSGKAFVWTGAELESPPQTCRGRPGSKPCIHTCPNDRQVWTIRKNTSSSGPLLTLKVASGATEVRIDRLAASGFGAVSWEIVTVPVCATSKGRINPDTGAKIDVVVPVPLPTEPPSDPPTPTPTVSPTEAPIDDGKTIPSDRMASLKATIENEGGMVLTKLDDEFDKYGAPLILTCTMRPKAVFVPKTEAGLRAVLLLLVELDLDFSVTVSRMNQNCMGMTDGYMINMRNFNTMQMEDGNTKIRVGAGTLGDEVNAYIHTLGNYYVNGLTCTMGSSVGPIFGGGFSWQMNPAVNGHMADNVLEFRIMDYEGVVRVVDENNHSDLFWALRAGGGQLGAVIEVVMNVHKFDEDKWTMVTYDLPCPNDCALDDVFAMMDDVGQWQNNLPLNFGHLTTFSPSVITLHGQCYDCDAASIVLAKYPGATKNTAWAPFDRDGDGTTKEAYEYNRNIGVAWLGSVPAPHSAKDPITFEIYSSRTPASTLSLGSYFFTKHTSPIVDVYKKVLEDDPEMANTLLWTVYLGGTLMNDIDSAASVHKGSKMVWSMATLDGNEEGFQTVSRGFAKIPETKAAYWNYRNKYTSEEMAFGFNLPRIKEIREKYDPDGVFAIERAQESSKLMDWCWGPYDCSGNGHPIAEDHSGHDHRRRMSHGGHDDHDDHEDDHDDHDDDHDDHDDHHDSGRPDLGCVCQCNAGWTGDRCDVADTPDPTATPTADPTLAPVPGYMVMARQYVYRRLKNDGTWNIHPTRWTKSSGFISFEVDGVWTEPEILFDDCKYPGPDVADGHICPREYATYGPFLSEPTNYKFSLVGHVRNPKNGKRAKNVTSMKAAKLDLKIYMEGDDPSTATKQCHADYFKPLTLHNGMRERVLTPVDKCECPPTPSGGINAQGFIKIKDWDDKTVLFYVAVYYPCRGEWEEKRYAYTAKNGNYDKEKAHLGYKWFQFKEFPTKVSIRPQNKAVTLKWFSFVVTKPIKLAGQDQTNKVMIRGKSAVSFAKNEVKEWTQSYSYYNMDLRRRVIVSTNEFDDDDEDTELIPDDLLDLAPME